VHGERDAQELESGYISLEDRQHICLWASKDFFDVQFLPLYRGKTGARRVFLTDRGERVIRVNCLEHEIGISHCVSSNSQEHALGNRCQSIRHKFRSSVTGALRLQDLISGSDFCTDRGRPDWWHVNGRKRVGRRVASINKSGDQVY